MSTDKAEEGTAGSPERLEGWKAIADFLKRDVRTAQRWRDQEGLPVYRHVHRKRATAYAYRSELEEWRRTRTTRPPHSKQGRKPFALQMGAQVGVAAAVFLAVLTAVLLWSQPWPARTGSGNAPPVEPSQPVSNETTAVPVPVDDWEAVFRDLPRRSALGLVVRAIDVTGSIYVGDWLNDKVLKFDRSGQAVLELGEHGSQPGQFNEVRGLDVNARLELYVADSGNDRIQKFDPYGRFLREWGEQGSSLGQFRSPHGVAVDEGGYVYVADPLNHRVQKFDRDGRFLTAWGRFGSAAGEFHNPNGIAIGPDEFVYVADTLNQRVQKFDLEGRFATEWSGVAPFENPNAIWFDLQGRVFVDDNLAPVEVFDNRGRYLATWTAGENGILPGWFPGMACGNVYVIAMDSGEPQIRKYRIPLPAPQFIAGWGEYGTQPGRFDFPTGLAVDGEGNLFVLDSHNGRVQKFDSTGQFLLTWGTPGSEPGQLQAPYGIVLDSSSDVLVVDTGNHRVQKFDATGDFLMEWGGRGAAPGQFDTPGDIAIDLSTNEAYVADTLNHRIQVFDSDGRFLRMWGQQGDGDREFARPTSVALSHGFVYVADTSNHRVQKFDRDGRFIMAWGHLGLSRDDFGLLTRLTSDDAGRIYASNDNQLPLQVFGCTGDLLATWGNGPGLPGPVNHGVGGIAIDPHGFIYLADSNNHRVLKFGANFLRPLGPPPTTH